MGRSSGAMIVPQQQLFINGNYDHFQRGTSQAAAPTTLNINTSFCPDRIFTVPGGATVALAQDATTAHLGTGSVSGMSVTGAGSVTTIDHGQIISQKKRTIYKQPLYFSCAVYNNSGGSFTPTLMAATPTTGGQGDSTASRGFTIRNNGGSGDALQACLNGAVTIVRGVIDPSGYTNINDGLKVYLNKSGTFTSGTITFSQLSLKPVAAYPSFFALDPDDELLKVKRHYQTGSAIHMSGPSIAQNVYFRVSFPVEFAIVPTLLTFSDSIGGAGKVTTIGGDLSVVNGVTPSTGVFGSDVKGFGFIHNGASFAGIQLNYVAIGELS
jgi:hypothetical protein